MDRFEWLRRLARTVSLSESRRVVRAPGPRSLVGAIGAAYVFLAVLVGQMVVFAHYGGGYFVQVLWGSGAPQWWNYPAVVAVQPWGAVGFPFFATVAMLVVAYGVGLGMTVVLVLAREMVQAQRSGSGAVGSAASLIGLSPALLSLVVLGACCSTTAAALAGLRLTSFLGGNDPGALLANSWVLGAFEIGVLWLALIAQEQLLSVYSARPAGLAAIPPEAGVDRATSSMVVARIARLALAISGAALLLRPIVDWATIDPRNAGVGSWIGWLAIDGLLGALALGAALGPRGLLAAFTAPVRRVAQRIVRAVSFAAGTLLAGWLPPGIASVAFHGWGNELLSSLGAPASLGALSPGLPFGFTLLGRWLLVFWIPSIFAIGLAVRPRSMLAPLARTVGRLGAPVSPSSGGLRPVDEGGERPAVLAR